MIRLLCGLLLLSLFGWISPVSAAVLTWNANTEVDLAGYKLYQSTTSGVYTTPVQTLGKVTTATVVLTPGATDVRYFFTLTAYNTGGAESPKSLEVNILIPKVVAPPPPAGSQITLTVLGTPSATTGWNVDGTTTIPQPVAMEIRVNGVLVATENTPPRCAFGEANQTCLLVVKAPATYTIEYRAIKNGVEVDRKSVIVSIPVAALPSAPKNLVIH